MITLLCLGLFFSCVEESKENFNETPLEIRKDIIPKTKLDSSFVYEHSDSLKIVKGVIPYWKWGDYIADHYWEEPGKTRLSFPGFRVKIDGKFDIERHNDTLSLFEDVGWYFEGRSWYISADNKSDKFEIELAVKQNIHEQMDYAWYSDSNFDEEKWYKNQYQHSEMSSFYQVEDSAGHYRIPWVHYDPAFFEAKYVKKYNLDTCSNHVDGEMGGTQATMIIHDKKCVFHTEYGLIKIIKTSVDGNKTEHFFKIQYSYGC